MMRRFFKHGLNYAAAAAINGIVHLAALPLYTRWLPPEQMGAWQLYLLAFLLLNLVLPLELTQAVGRLQADRPVPEHRGRLGSVCLTWTTGVFILLIGFSIAWPGGYTFAVYGRPEPAWLGLLGAVGMLLHAGAMVTQNQLKWNAQPRAAATNTVLHLSGSVALGLLAVGVFDLQLAGLVGGNLIASGLAFAAGLWQTRRSSPLRFMVDWALFKQMFAFSWPLVPAGLAIFGSRSLDRWMLNAFEGLDVVGVFSVAGMVALVVTLLMAAARSALMPLVYENMDQPETRQTVGRLLNGFTWGISLLIIATFAAGPWVVDVFLGAAYVEAAGVLPWLMISTFFFTAVVFAPGLSIAKRTRMKAAVAIVTCALNLALNWWLIQALGMLGAALATDIAAAVFFLGHLLAGQRHFRVPLAVGWLTLCASAVATAGALTVLDRRLELWLMLALFVLLPIGGLMRRREASNPD